jgi:hypothetical protein
MFKHMNGVVEWPPNQPKITEIFIHPIRSLTLVPQHLSLAGIGWAKDSSCGAELGSAAAL